ncbi:DUF4118 domain-containing protein [Dactylosporangium sp. AC04546]|uniref:sensor histidine kinase n=1 Tax=Dactylosporangium sp. AC04546 TaxID=2862460 RepID=UPI001EE0C575|nr:ATP-binding protein [Dactylosporangium sp. AC04546]WVK78847.1 DUF4118 domain-containing protein [Dactylosporangium sp. AC04546]
MKPDAALPRRRGWLGAGVAVAGLAATTGALQPAREELSLASVALLFLIPVVAAAGVGGIWPALGAAVTADALVNYFFLPPYQTLRVNSADNVIVLVVYILVAVTVAIVMDVVARQRAAAASTEVRARELAEIDRLRTGLLDAVHHDLRTPLAGIKAAVSSLRSPEVSFSEPDRTELTATIEDATDRMIDLVENLLSLSRLRTGTLSVDPQPTALDAVVATAALHLADHRLVDVDVPDDLPLAWADPGLLERVVANLLANALAMTPQGTRVRVTGDTGDAAAATVRLLVVDHGPGLTAEEQARMFEPFQRYHDHGGGLGLGLAIVRGFVEAMGGRVTPSQTPGGGLTIAVELPSA